MLRQLLTEAVVLGVAGAALGLVIADVATRALVAAQPADIPRLEEVGVNGAVVAVTFAIALATSLAFGILPALQFSGNRLPSALRDSARGSASGGGHRMRSALVVAEMALAVVLLIGAGLLIRSFIQLTRVDPGFRAEQALSFRVTLQSEKYKEDAATRIRVAEFEERLRALPGVTAVAATSVLPLSGRGAMLGFAVEGVPPLPNVNPEIAVASATPDTSAPSARRFAAAGRSPNHDHTDAPRVAIVNEAAVRRWFARQDPAGQTRRHQRCRARSRRRRRRRAAAKRRAADGADALRAVRAADNPVRQARRTHGGRASRPSRARFAARFGRSIPTWRSPTSRR